VIEPSTSRTCFTVHKLAEPSNGIGVAIFDPERNAANGGNAVGFPNPNQWGADCLVGIYGSGCFFGIITERVLTWQEGLVLEVIMVPGCDDGTLNVTFATEGENGERLALAEGDILSVASTVKLAVALYSPDDKVSVESVW